MSVDFDSLCQLIDPSGPLFVGDVPPKQFSQSGVERMADNHRSLLPLDLKLP